MADEQSPKVHWTSGIPIIGGALNAFFQGVQNRKSRKWSEKMYGRQRADALADWNLQNEYNSPAAQMERLKEGGLNPNLVYGNGADAQSSGTVRSSGVPAAQFDAPRFDHLGDGLGMYYDLKIKQAQYDNLRTQNTVAQQDALLKAAQIIQTTASTGKTHADTASVEFDTMLKNQIKDISVEAARAGLNKTLADTQYTLNQDERAQAQNASSLQEAAERILRSRAERSKIPFEKAMILKQMENISKDVDLKQLDIELKRMGINPQDPTWQRILGRIINEGIKAPLENKQGVQNLKRELNSLQFKKN